MNRRLYKHVLLVSTAWISLFGQPAIAQNELSISWGSMWGFYKSDGMTPLLNDGPAYALLIDAGPDGVIDPVNAGNPNWWLGGDDVLLMSTTLNVAEHDYWGYGIFGLYTMLGPQAVSVVYGRVFENTAPAVGQFYYDGPMIIASWQPPGSPPTVYDMGRNQGDSDTLDLVILPNDNTTSVTVTVPSGGLALIRNDYDGAYASMALSNAIGGQLPPGSQFIRFNSASQTYLPTITRDRYGSWGPGGTTVLARGQSYWLRIPPVGGLVVSNHYQVVFSGVNPTSSFQVSVQPGGNTLGYPYPVDQMLGSMALPGALPNTSLISLWDAPSQSIVTYSKSARGTWIPSISAVTIKAGQGFIVNIPGTSPVLNFTEPLPY